MVGSGPNREESMESQRQDHFVNLEQKRDRKVSVHIPPILAGVNLKAGATFLMRRILKPCN